MPDIERLIESLQETVRRKTAEGYAAMREAAEAAFHAGVLAIKDIEKTEPEDWEDGARWFAKAVELDPDYADACRCLMHLGREEEGLRALQRFVDLAPEHALADKVRAFIAGDTVSADAEGLEEAAAPLTVWRAPRLS
jgi:hypothetical protein